MSSVPSSAPQVKSCKHIGAIAGISIALVVIAVATICIVEFVIKPKILCWDKGIKLCKDIKNKFPVKKPSKGKVCYRLMSESTDDAMKTSRLLE